VALCTRPQVEAVQEGERSRLEGELRAAEAARAALQERLQQQQQRAEQLAAAEAAAQGRLAQAEAALQQLRVLLEGQAAARVRGGRACCGQQLRRWHPRRITPHQRWRLGALWGA
jgi:hypothetical protein